MCLNRHPVGYAEARVARLNPECELYRPERARSHQALISATSIGSFVPSVKFVARFQGVAPYLICARPRGLAVNAGSVAGHALPALPIRAFCLETISPISALTPTRRFATYVKRGRIAYVTINRPDVLNALHTNGAAGH